MLPYTAYDIITVLNREIDLKRSPVSEYEHAFDIDRNRPPEDGQNDTSGPGRPVSPSLLARLIATIRALGGHRPKTQSAQVG